MTDLRVVGIIPPGITIDTALTAMSGMGACYPTESLFLSNDSSTGGMLIIHDPNRSAATKPGPAPENEAGAMGLSLGADSAGDLIAYAFSCDGQEQQLKALTLGLAAMLNTVDAANYLTLSVEVPEVGRYAVTIQRCPGKTPAERIAELEKQLTPGGPASRRSCTGVTATWCPNHGDCTCPDRGEDLGRDMLDGPDCPLHGDDSNHAQDEPA